MRGTDDRLIYRKSSWKAALLGLTAIPYFAAGATVRQWVPTAAWPFFGLLLLALGASSLFFAFRDGFGRGRLVISREGLELTGEGRRVWLLWRQIEKIVVGYDSDGPGALEIWTGGARPRVSTDGWDRTPSQIAMDIEEARDRWREDRRVED